MCSGRRPYSLIASSHFMPGCGTMIPSLGSPRSPIVGPSPFGDSSPQTALADGDWIPDVLHRCCKSRLSSVFSTQSFTVACGMEVVGVPSPGGGFVQRMMICTCCGGLTFSLVVCPCWSVLFWCCLVIPLFSPFVLSGPTKVNHVIGVHYRLAGICGSIYSGGDLSSSPVISLKKTN